MELINFQVNFTQWHRLQHFDVIAVVVFDTISLCRLCFFFNQKLLKLLLRKKNLNQNYDVHQKQTTKSSFKFTDFKSFSA
jgi:hypothetical protein